MSLTPSNMLPLGTLAPDFNLPNGAGNYYNRDSIKLDNGLLVVFMCNHCPYVEHLFVALAELEQRLRSFSVGMVGINSNNIEQYPADAPEKMLEIAERYKFNFPYLYDASQAVAKSYDAACTPDFFLFDGALQLVYRGQFDASRPGSDVPITGKDLYAAVEAMAENQPISADQIPSMGCNIKWK